eukprot:4660699-Pleurochrysis_carterae.AAC.1
MLNANVYSILHAALLAIGGGHDVQPFDTYWTGSRFASATRSRRPARATFTTFAECMLPDSPRALLACFSFYAPRPRSTGR